MHFFITFVFHHHPSILIAYSPKLLRHDSSVGIASGYGLDSQGLIQGRGKRFFTFSQCPYWLCGPSSLLSLWINWQGCEADPSLSSSVESRMVELYFHSPIHLHGMVLNYLSKGATFTLSYHR
jgi:hypothetical protein